MNTNNIVTVIGAEKAGIYNDFFSKRGMATLFHKETGVSRNTLYVTLQKGRATNGIIKKMDRFIEKYNRVVII